MAWLVEVYTSGHSSTWVHAENTRVVGERRWTFSLLCHVNLVSDLEVPVAKLVVLNGVLPWQLTLGRWIAYTSGPWLGSRCCLAETLLNVARHRRKGFRVHR